MRSSWICRITSRTRPRRSRSSSRLKSSATTSPPSRETANPSCERTLSSRSSASSSTGPSGSSMTTLSPASRARAAAAPSSFASAGFKCLTDSPRRGPTVLKFGTSSKRSTSESSLESSRRSTLSSSSTTPGGGEGSPGGRNTSALASGWRTLTPASALAARPSDVRRRATSIDASSAGSIMLRSTSGQSARWTDALSSAPVRPRHMASARNGVIGASMVAIVVSTSRRVACAASESDAGADGSVRQNRRRDLRTYQLERSSTRPAIGAAAAKGS